MFKNFCSFTLDSSSITTKVINSNPKDKIHLFPGQKGNKGYNLFILMIMPQTVIIMFFLDMKRNKYPFEKKFNHLIILQNINELFKIH